VLLSLPAWTLKQYPVVIERRSRTVRASLLRLRACRENERPICTNLVREPWNLPMPIACSSPFLPCSVHSAEAAVVCSWHPALPCCAAFAWQGRPPHTSQLARHGIYPVFTHRWLHGHTHRVEHTSDQDYHRSLSVYQVYAYGYQGDFSRYWVNLVAFLLATCRSLGRLNP
jgi:hypothetical protein